MFQRLLLTSRSSLSPLTLKCVFNRSGRVLTGIRYNATDAGTATSRATATNPQSGALSIDPLPDVKGHDGTTDWSRSYAGLSTQPFPKEVAEILQAPIDPLDIEVKPG